MPTIDWKIDFQETVVDLKEILENVIENSI